ncbi:hypothetical protein [Moraxella oblonga]|uniref:hypothetical protein n=1 Tax=Moraxella oblonga TaxID=200413 RepID=UPI000831C09C|nr:hypothetical protein [Moraxella oblonga]
MDIKNVLSLCKNLSYSDKSLLAKYFDFITFVADIDEFYQASDEFFLEIKHHKQYHEFYHFLQKNIFNVIEKEDFESSKESCRTIKKKRRLPKNKPKQQPQVGYRRYGIPIEHNFFDEFYQGLYQNSWQDYGYQNDLGNHFIALDDTWYANYNN